MGKAHSEDLRERVYGEIESGASRRSAARRFGVSVSTSIRLAQRMAQKGSLAPERQGRPSGSGKLAAYHDQLIRWVEKQPDITMPELAALLLKERQATAHPASLARILRELGFTFKKNAAGHRSRAR